MKNTEAKVGAFIVASAVVLAVAVYFVSKAEFRGKEVPYRMYLRNAGGLEPGTAVLFGGISVGRVTMVQPDQADPARIEISLGVKPGIPINAKSIADVSSVTLLGNPAVFITTGSKDAARLPPGAVIPTQETATLDQVQRKVLALADTAQTTLASVNADVSKITADAHQVLANLNNLTGRANQQRMAAILFNADRVTAQLSSKIGPTLDNVNRTVTNANRTITNANQTITSLRQPILVDLTEVHRTLQEVHGVADNVQSILSDNRDNIDYSLQNLRITTDNLNGFTRTIREEPWSLVWIRQPQPRKVPQEKGK